MNTGTDTYPIGSLDAKLVQLSQRMADRVSRRSFLGKLGAAGVAASVGTSAQILYSPQRANAAVSEFCGNVMSTQYCNTNVGCYCGCWNASGCSFCDCCDNTGWCGNHGGCHNSHLGNPVCCNKKEWSSPAGCGTVNKTTIICRDEFC